jgi:hypothetical protein
MKQENQQRYQRWKAMAAVLVLVGFGAQAGAAQSLSGISASFIDIGFGARPVAMGQAFVGLADDVESVYWNPAGVARLSGYHASFMHARQLGMIDYNYLVASAPLPGGAHGVGISVIASGDEALREFSLHGVYAREIGPLQAGVGLKFRRSSFGNNLLSGDDYVIFDPDEISDGLMNQVSGTGQGFGLDVGLLFRASPTVSYGLMVRDLFAPINWDSRTQNPDRAESSYNEGLPTEVIVGSAFQPYPSFLVTADFRPAIYEDTQHAFRFGGEYGIMDIVFLRAGTQQAFNAETQNKYTLGLGIDVPIGDVRTGMNYSYMIEELGHTHRFSLNIRFAKEN